MTAVFAISLIRTSSQSIPIIPETDDGLWHDIAYFPSDDGLWHDDSYFGEDDGNWHDNIYF